MNKAEYLDVPDVSELNQLGFEICNVALDKPDLKLLQQSAKERANSFGFEKLKNVPFVDLLTYDDFRNPLNPFIQFAFSEHVLPKAVAYFKGKPRLLHVALNLSLPMTNNKLIESQLWHVDFDDSKLLRVVLYLSDVDESAGPFTLVSKLTSRRIRSLLFVQRLTDQMLEKKVQSSEKLCAIGKSGTLLFVDTANCFHQGSRCTKARLALFITFSTQSPANELSANLPSCRQNMLRLYGAKFSSPSLARFLLG